MTPPAILSMANLEFAYHRNLEPVLKNLSLDVPAGAITAILGPNGSGKTTLLRIMLGVLSPGSGAVLIEGKPLRSYSRREASRWIGLVPQAEHIPFALSVLEYVLLGRSPYLGMLEMPGEHDYSIALTALKELGLFGLTNRSVIELSSGEQQMVMLARALAQETRILLLDEPTSHLDLSNKGRILHTLRQLADRGVTIVFTTHDPEAAIAIAGYLVLVRDGQTLAGGSVDQVLTTDNLRATYGVPVRVMKLGDRPVVLLENLNS
jgi:iron complex transport system ATP-binding protein